MRIDWNLMVRYLSGECSDEEAAQVRDRVAEDPEREALMEDLRQVWETTASSPPPQWHKEDSWRHLRQHMREGDEQRFKWAPFDRAPVPRWAASPSRRRLLGVAAVVAVVAVIVLFTVQPWKEPPQKGTAPTVVATQRGEQVTQRLADGTRVRLNADSKFTYPHGFGKDAREVHLEGEAFFEVAPDPERPFVVRTEKAVVRVLGTAFDVRAYAGDDEVHVAVVEGRVAVRAAQSVGQGAIVARPGDVVTVGDRHMNARHSRNIDRYLAWTKGRLVFVAAPFEEVMRRLERTYAREVELTVSGDSVGRLSASFGDEPLSEIIDGIAAVLDLKYRHEGQKIVFYSAGAK